MLAKRISEVMRHDDKGQRVSALTLRELTDLGLSRAELSELVGTPAAFPPRVEWSALAFGVTKEEVVHNWRAFAEVACVCATCTCGDDCESDVEAGRVAVCEELGDCPNAPIFKTLSGSGHA